MQGASAIVTGAASGIGRAIAQRLADAGMDVLAVDLEPDDEGPGVPHAADLTTREGNRGAVDAAVERFGRVDVMLNNAGLMAHSPLERRKIDDWDRMIDVHIKGVLYGIAAALPHMQRQKAGQFINVSSVAGHKVGVNNAVYAATKTAVRVLSEGLRQEVKPYNLRTTIISPGAVATELPNSVTEPDIAAGIGQFYEHFAIPADASARAVAFAISQPEDVDINEILFRPTRQEL